MSDLTLSIMSRLDDSGSRIGQARFCKENDNFIISISIHEKYRGKGFAKTIVELACKELEDTHFFKGKIIAYIEKQNKPSIKVIVNNNFDFSGEKMIHGHMYNVYKRKINNRI